MLVAWGLRAYRLGAQELRGDEAGSWSFVVHETGPTALVERIIREGDPHPPLHHWVLQLWVRIFGDSEWALRTPSALLSLLLVALLYQLGARAASPELGVGAAVITALHPFQIWLAQDVRHMYQLSILFVLLATLRLPGLLRGNSRAYWVYVASGTLAMYSHYYALFGLVAHGAYVFANRGMNRMRWMLASGAVALLLVPWAVVILPVYVRGQLADPTTIPPLQYLSRIAADFSLGPVVLPALGLPVAGLGLLVAVYGAASLRRSKRPAWASFLIVWPLLSLAGIYAVTTQRSTFNSFYFLVAFPAVYLLVAAGWRALLRRPQGRRPDLLARLLLTLFRTFSHPGLAVVLVGAAFVSVGLLASSLTDNQIVAVVVAFFLLLLLWMIDWSSQFTGPALAEILRYLSLMAHMQDMTRGVIDTNDVVFFISMTVFFLFLTFLVIESRRWRQ